MAWSAIVWLLSAVLVLQSAAQSTTAPVDSVKVFVKGEGGYYCHKIPYLLSTPGNALIAFAEARGKNGRTSCDDFSGTDLVFKRSEDRGATWSSLTVFYSNSTEESTNVVGNAAPVVDATTGRIWVPFCRNNEEVFISYSDDDGRTWSTPEPHPELVLPEWKWVGLGPPAGLQLQPSGRLLIPSYHTTAFKGDGCASKGHTLISDDHGATWSIGSVSFGAPFFANECQAVQLTNGSVLINARTISTHRVQVVSDDGGETFNDPVVVEDPVQQTIEGCQGSIFRGPSSYGDGTSASALFFSNPNNDLVIRRNMTVFRSLDEGSTWEVHSNVDRGAVSYSAMAVLPAASDGDSDGDGDLFLLYERSDVMQIVFEPDEIVVWKVPK